MSTQSTETGAHGVHLYGVGICVTSVCAPSDMSIGDLEREVSDRLALLAGEACPAQLSMDTHFATGETNPCPCSDFEGRTHYLLDF